MLLIEKTIIRTNYYLWNKFKIISTGGILENWNYSTSTETFQENTLTKVIEQIDNIEYDIVSTSMETQSVIEQEVTTPIKDI